MIWHHESAEAVLTELQSDTEYGLTAEEAAGRLAMDGQNRYYEKISTPIPRALAHHMKSLPVILLMLAAAWQLVMCVASLISGQPAEWLPAVISLLLPLLGALMCVLWERRATSHLHRVSNTQNNTVAVLRDGEWLSLSAADVVRGDVLRLETGMIVPADARLITADDLRCDECVLTGEETEIIKSADAQLEGITPMRDRVNMVYAGCGVSHGGGTAVVVATAQTTEYALMLNDPRRRNSPLPVIGKDIDALGRLVMLPVLVIDIVLLILSIVRGAWSMNTVPVLLAAAAAAIPTGLTAVSTIAMATGMRQINDRRADVRELSVMGELSRVSVIIANKTGVFTSDEKRPVYVFTGGQTEMLTRMPSARAQLLIRMATLCTENDTQMTGRDNDLIGNPTESAIIEYARDIGMERKQLMEGTPRLAMIPFDPARRCTSVVHLVSGRRLMITMGAPDAVLKLCAEDIGGARRAEREMEEEALRVLAVAYKYVDDIAVERFDISEESNMTLAGLIALGDHPREDSEEAVSACAKGGITTVMTTGDAPVNARAVGEQLGILRDKDELITGEQLAFLSDEQLSREIHLYRVFAHVNANDRLRIVRAWQKTDATVAVTGSGLADVPVLQAADVGVACGTADCDMTRDASDVALHDNRFSSLVDVIRGARGVYANIRKATQYMITCGISLLCALLLCVIVHGTLPLSPLALALYWGTGLAITLSLGNELPDRRALFEKPRHGISRLMPPASWTASLWQGLLIGISTFIAFDVGRMGAGDESQILLYGATTAFITLTLSRLWLALLSGGSGGKHGGRLMPLIVMLCFIAMALCVVISPVGALFGFTPVLPSNWLLSALFSLIPAAAVLVTRTVFGLTRSVKNS